MLRSVYATVHWVVQKAWRPQTERGTKLHSVTHHGDTQPGINTQAQSLAAASPGLWELTSTGSEVTRGTHTHTDTHTHTVRPGPGPPRAEIMRSIVQLVGAGKLIGFFRSKASHLENLLSMLLLKQLHCVYASGSERVTVDT